MKRIIWASGICILIAALVYGIFFSYYIQHAKKDDLQTAQNLAKAKAVFDAIPIWHKKITTDQVIKVGIITDTHVHPSRINRANKSDNALRYLEGDNKKPLVDFVTHMRKFQPAFIVHLGDVIEGTGEPSAVGMQGVALVRKELSTLGVPMLWAVGNHDLRSLTKEQFRETCAQPSLDYVYDEGDYRFVVLDANYNVENYVVAPGQNSYIPGKLHPDTLLWLKKQLATDKRVFIFIHQGTFPHLLPSDPEIIENEAFEKEEGEEVEEEKINGVEYYMKTSLANVQELNDILKEYRVDGIFNGHMEARAYEVIDRVRHYSLTGTKKSKTYPRSYFELTISGGVPDVTMYYTPTGSILTKSVDFESGEK